MLTNPTALIHSTQLASLSLQKELQPRKGLFFFLFELLSTTNEACMRLATGHGPTTARRER
jgi:hypothetical protein